ncbi:MAG TPA: hypothetical protein VL688_09815 [Verrucomicrobiae bacterium]|jgi:hypothetical protein|nr:hypothetical protein [Verrucomicrobiae bacterium]
MTKWKWFWPLVGFAFALVAADAVNAALGWPSWLLKFLFDLERESTIQTWFSSILWFACAEACYGCASIEKRNPARNSWLFLAAVFAFCSLDEVVSLHEHIGHSLFRMATSEETFRSFPHSSWVIGLAPVLLAGAAAVYKVFGTCFKESPRAGRAVICGFTILLLGAVGMEFIFARDARSSPFINGLEPVLEEFLEMFGVILMLWGLRARRAFVNDAVHRDLWE